MPDGRCVAAGSDRGWPRRRNARVISEGTAGCWTGVLCGLC